MSKKEPKPCVRCNGSLMKRPPPDCTRCGGSGVEPKRARPRKLPKIEILVRGRAMTSIEVRAELEDRGVKPHAEGDPHGQLEYLECLAVERYPGGDCEHGTPRIFECGEGCECVHRMPLAWGCLKCGTGAFV